jgi:hypothetical protein
MVFTVISFRKYSYERVDTSGINMMLNANDVSEYLKLGKYRYLTMVAHLQYSIPTFLFYALCWGCGF